MRNYSTTKPPAGAVVDWTHPLSRGLVGLWSFSEGGGAAGVDSTGGAPMGLGGGAAFMREGIALNGSSGFASTPAERRSPSLRFTMAVAIVRTAASGSTERLFVRTNTAGSPAFERYIQVTSDGTMQVGYTDTSAGNNFAQTSVIVPIGKPVILSMTYDGAIIRAFHQGAQVASAASTATPQDSAVAVYEVGRLFAGAYFYGFIGVVQWAGVWRRSLHPSEIAAIHTSPYSMLSRPVGQRNFAGGSGLLLARRRAAA